MKNTPVKSIVAIAIGAALFFVCGRFVAIPSPVPNTNISIQYCSAQPSDPSSLCWPASSAML